MRDVLLFAVVRVLLIAVLWWLAVQIGIGFYLAGLVAVLIGMLVSILFLAPLRSRAADRWRAADERRRAQRPEPRDEDADAEDELLEADERP